MLNSLKIKKNEGLFCNSNYKIFLKLLRCNCSPIRTHLVSKYTHPRAWIPPPCLTSEPQKVCYLTGEVQSEANKPIHRSYSHPDIYDSSSSSKMEKDRHANRGSKMPRRKMPSGTALEQADEIGGELKQLRKERELLKEAQLKMELGEALSPSLKALVLKWRNQEALFQQNNRPVSVKSSSGREIRATPIKPPGKHGKKCATKRTERMARDLEMSFRQAKEEEERLKIELKELRKDTKKSRETRRPNVKLKKSSSCSEYRYVAMKRKYEDLLQYLMKMEGETKDLRMENEVLHSALKEQDQFPLKERISFLEQEIVNRNAYVKECEEQMKNLHSLQEENFELRNLVESLKVNAERERDKRSRQEEEEEDDDDFEEQWLEKLNDTKALYEKAIQGYKEELRTTHSTCEMLENKLKSLIKHYEESEEELMLKYETQIRNLRSEVVSKELPKKEGICFLKLESIIREKEIEIEKLKEALKLQSEANDRKWLTDKVQEQIFTKLEELMNKTANVSTDDSAVLSLKETLKKCFEDLNDKNKENKREMEEFLLKENESLKENLRDKISELSKTKLDFEEAKRDVEKMISKCEFLESKVTRGTEDERENLKALKVLPHLLKESENKLWDSQSTYQNCLAENKVLHERLKNNGSELEIKRERIAELEERIRDLKSMNTKLEREIENMENKTDILQSQVEKKNKILEKNSTQLEDRIREYSSISSQLERLREDHNKEISNLKSLNQDSHLHSQLQELQAQNARLESQLNVLRIEKSHCEKSFRKQASSLEEEVSQLKIRNKTLQKHLETIQTTYKSMFPLEGNWPRALTLNE